MSIAIAWAYRLIGLAMAMVLPGLAGIWVDGKLGTVALFTVVGFGLGLTVGVWQLLQFTKPRSGNAP